VKALVIGSGGREHALAWKLLQSPNIEEVMCVPGNGGTATLPGCRNLGLGLNDFEGIARVALVNNLSLVVVGPEQPLADGIVDYLKEQGLMVFGPSQAGAQIEASKAWAKALMMLNADSLDQKTLEPIFRLRSQPFLRTQNQRSPISKSKAFPSSSKPMV